MKGNRVKNFNIIVWLGFGVSGCLGGTPCDLGGGQLSQEPKLPIGFYKEGGQAVRQVSVGSKFGRMHAACIKNGKICFFNTVLMKQDPWVEHDARDKNGVKIETFDYVSVANDGTVCAISQGGAYRYWDEPQEMVKMVRSKSRGHKRKAVRVVQNGWWEKLEQGIEGLVFNQIAVGSAKSIWAVDTRGDVFQYTDQGWRVRKRKHDVVAISVGYDGAVGLITTSGTLQLFVDNKRVQIKDSPLLSSVSVASKDLMWGVGRDSEGVSPVWTFDKGVWLQQPSEGGAPAQNIVAFTQVSINPAGTAFLVDAAGAVYANGEEGFSLQLKPKKVAATCVKT